MVFAVGVSGLQIDEHPEDGCQHLIQPCFGWERKSWLPFLCSDTQPCYQQPETLCIKSQRSPCGLVRVEEELHPP